MDFFKKVFHFIKTRKFLKIAGIIFAIYVVVIGLTVVSLDSYTSHGQKIVVPNLVGKNVKTIESILTANNLQFEILDSLYNPEVAEGTILDQDPIATNISQLFVKEGRIIRVRVSKRSRMVEVPSLIDKSLRFAESILKNRGFKYTITYQNTTEAHGAVLNQMYRGEKIKEGTKIPIGSTIALIVGRNEGGIPIPIPDLYGLTIFEARDRLASITGMSFFPVCNECKSYEDTLAARINAQTPEFLEGVMIPSGSTITVNAVLNFVDTRGPAPQ